LASTATGINNTAIGFSALNSASSNCFWYLPDAVPPWKPAA
jgi:hypothetical protein